MISIPKVSFVVPAYNEERLLLLTLQAIASEISRSKCSAEIIVVNDGSTDSTPQIAREFGAVTLNQEVRRGLVNARRVGLSVARGELVANIDADTVVPEGWLRLVLDEFERNPSLVCVSGPHVHYDLSKLARLAVRIFYCGGYLLYVLNQFIFRIGSLVQGGNFVVKRQALVKIGGYSNDFIFYGEDTDIACRLIAVGKVKFNFALWASSSGRRLLREGIVRIGFRYTLNFLWATWLRRPFTTAWEDVR